MAPTVLQLLIDFVLQTFEQTDNDLRDLNLDKYFDLKSQESLQSIEGCLAQQPMSEIAPTGDGLFKIKICSNVYAQVIKCWSHGFHLEASD